MCRGISFLALLRPPPCDVDTLATEDRTYHNPIQKALTPFCSRSRVHRHSQSMPLITKSLIATTVYLTATVHLVPYTRFLCDLAADYWLTIRSYIYNFDPPYHLHQQPLHLSVLLPFTHAACPVYYIHSCYVPASIRKVQVAWFWALPHLF